jgi:hypothetical protein
MTLNARKYTHDMWHVAMRPAGMVALLYAIAAFGGSAAYDYFRDSFRTRENHTAQIIQSFDDTSKEFDALVAAMANGVMDSGKPVNADKSKLVANLEPIREV